MAWSDAGLHPPSTMLSLGVSLRLWQSMPASDQAILAACAEAENSLSLAEFRAHRDMARSALASSCGVRFQTYGDEVTERAREAVADILAATAASDQRSKMVYESYMGFRKFALGEVGLSTHAYIG